MKLMQEQKTDWGRIAQSIRQKFRREPEIKKRVDVAIETLMGLAPLLGPQSRTRRVLRNIGTSIAASKDEVTVISPICLSIPAGNIGEPAPSGLVEKHISFMEGLSGALPNWKLVCMFPPAEREDEDAERHIEKTCALTKAAHAGNERVEIKRMTSAFPGIISSEEDTIQEIVNAPYLSKMCSRLMGARSEYYFKIGIPQHLWARRTRRTMAQYVILGRVAALNNYLICNHTSANILCEAHAGGGVLHNPVGFM